MIEPRSGDPEGSAPAGPSSAGLRPAAGLKGRRKDERALTYSSATIAGGDHAAGDDLGVNSAIGVTVGLQQRFRNRHVARGRVRIDIGRGASHDALHHLEPGCRRWRASGRSDRIRARPASPTHAGCRESAADAPAAPTAFSSSATLARLMIETTLRGTSEKLWPSREQHLGRSAQFIGKIFREKRFDRRAPFRSSAGRLARPLFVLADRQRMAGVVVVAAQRRQALVAHQHQEAGLRENIAALPGRSPIGPFSMAYAGRPAGSGRASA